jgi:hypothetical protein
MARWTVSGETVTLETGPRRPLESFLARYGLRIAVILGLVEALVAWAGGFTLVMLLVGLLAILGYLWARRRVPRRLRRPLGVLGMAQGIAGLAPLAVGAGLLVAVMIGGLLLLIMLLVLLGDRRRL